VVEAFGSKTAFYGSLVPIAALLLTLYLLRSGSSRADASAADRATAEGRTAGDQPEGSRVD